MSEEPIDITEWRNKTKVRELLIKNNAEDLIPILLED